jgi:Domain of unknown function (DUF4389)
MAYPIHFDVQLPERMSRLTTFFRLILVIPHVIVLILYAILAYILVILAWFAILFTGRYPSGMFRVVSRFLIYSVRVNCYLYLLTDRYPPFGGGSPGDGYPVQVSVDEPERLSRLTTFFRAVLGIPVYLLLEVLANLAELLAFFAWFVIIAIGRLPQGLFEVMELPARYGARGLGYFMLLTDVFPWFQEETLADPDPWTGPAA